MFHNIRFFTLTNKIFSWKNAIFSERREIKKHTAAILWYFTTRKLIYLPVFTAKFKWAQGENRKKHPQGVDEKMPHILEPQKKPPYADNGGKTLGLPEGETAPKEYKKIKL